MWEMDRKEGWETKNWCFQIVVLRVPWRVPRRSNQSILNKINTEYSLEGLMLKLKLQCFGHLMQRTDSLENTLMLGKTEGKRRWEQSMRWLDGTTNPMDCSTPGFPVLHHLPELAQTPVHWVNDAIQPSFPLLPPFSSCLSIFPSIRVFSNE